jgi:hypothetical protein
MSDPVRVLIVANRTAATPTLIDRVRKRAGREPCEFTLLVPALPDVLDPQEEARKTLELALPLLEDAASGPVKGVVGPSDAFRAVEQTLAREQFDEVIISTLPQRVSAWLKRDLPTRVQRLGMPVTVVRAPERPHAAVWSGAP